MAKHSALAGCGAKRHTTAAKQVSAARIKTKIRRERYHRRRDFIDGDERASIVVGQLRWEFNGDGELAVHECFAYVQQCKQLRVQRGWSGLASERRDLVDAYPEFRFDLSRAKWLFVEHGGGEFHENFLA